MLFGVLRHVGAEFSAHETITVEQEVWANIGQLAAEYEAIASAAQRDRWANLVRASGLTEEEAEDAIAFPAFEALNAELRRAEANHHDIEALLPRLVRARGFTDADDVAAVLHYRVARATARPAGSGRARKAPRLIASLIPEAAGAMSGEFRQALIERLDLIETRATALLDSALTEKPTLDAGARRSAEGCQHRGDLAAPRPHRCRLPRPMRHHRPDPTRHLGRRGRRAEDRRRPGQGRRGSGPQPRTGSGGGAAA